MEPSAVLDLMKRYFVGKQPAESLESFGEQSPRAWLKESLDVVDFVVYLEEELGRDIDLNQLGDKLLNQNFDALAEEVSAMLAEGA